MNARTHIKHALNGKPSKKHIRRRCGLRGVFQTATAALSVIALLQCGSPMPSKEHSPAELQPGARATSSSIAKNEREQPAALGEDWPARMHDIQRTGVTGEAIGPPLTPAWTYTTERAPVPAWTESPAIHDYLHNWYDLKPRQHFDRCMDVAVAGTRVFFGSSVSGTVTCLDISDGRELWSFFTDAPVRFAPHVAANRVYF